MFLSKKYRLLSRQQILSEGIVLEIGRRRSISYALILMMYMRDWLSKKGPERSGPFLFHFIAPLTANVSRTTTHPHNAHAAHSPQSIHPWYESIPTSNPAH